MVANGPVHLKKTYSTFPRTCNTSLKVTRYKATVLTKTDMLQVILYDKIKISTSIVCTCANLFVVRTRNTSVNGKIQNISEFSDIV